MTRAKISEYSATANDNTDVNGINIAEGCPPSSMNNMGREIMAALKRFQVGSDGDGVTVGGSLVVSGSTSVNTFNVDVISEKTSAAGVTVDGVLLKDSQVSTDQINEKTSATGVTIDGVLLKDSEVTTDVIKEKTSATGVTVDSVLLKDGLVGIGADGSASAPSIYRASDTNTGIFFPAADTIAFAEGGAEAMRITSDGRLGVGTSSPEYQIESYKETGLAYVVGKTPNVEMALAADETNLAGYLGTRTNHPIRFVTNGDERMRIDSSGNVAINTTSGSGGRVVIAQSNATQPAIYLPTDESTIQGPNTDTKILMGGNLVLQSGNVTGVSVKNASGYIYFATGSTPTERMRIASNGDLFINRTSTFSYANGKVCIEADGVGNPGLVVGVGVTTSYNNVVLGNGNGNVGSIVTNGSSTAFNTSSDYRLKENIAPMTGALAKVLELNPVTYTWKVDGSSGEGFIAHELQAVCPDAVSGEKDKTEIRQVEVSPAVPATYDEEGNKLTTAVEAVYEEREVPVYQGVDTSFLVATLTSAIQELKAINDAQASRIETLEAKVATLEAQPTSSGE